MKQALAHNSFYKDTWFVEDLDTSPLIKEGVAIRLQAIQRARVARQQADLDKLLKFAKDGYKCLKWLLKATWLTFAYLIIATTPIFYAVKFIVEGVGRAWQSGRVLLLKVTSRI